MSDTYTPTTHEVRARYNADEFGYSAATDDPCPDFDRWLDSIIRNAKTEAWDEAIGAALDYVSGPPDAIPTRNPYAPEAVEKSGDN